MLDAKSLLKRAEVYTPVSFAITVCAPLKMKEQSANILETTILKDRGLSAEPWGNPFERMRL